MRILHRSLIHIALIVSVVFLIYSNTFTAPFELDDGCNIADNSAIRDLHNFIDTSHFSNAEIQESLRPILKTRYFGYLSFALNYAVHGLDVRGYHLVNVLIHITNSLLLYVMLQLTFRTPRLCGMNTGSSPSLPTQSVNYVTVFTTLLFAVHPIQTQAVTYIVQRFASLAALFYLLSMVSYIRFRLDNTAGPKRYFFYLISLTSAIIAMKTKEFAILLPIIIALYEFTFFDGGTKRRILQLIPHALTVSVIPLSLMNVSAAMVSGAHGNVSRIDYLLTQFRVIITYLRLMIFPINQNLDYDYPVYRSFFAPEVLLSFLFLLLMLVLGIWLYMISRDPERKDNYWFLLVSCGIFWFFITAAPESSIIPIKDVIFEHRMYLPSVGLFLVAAVTVELLILHWSKRFSHTRTTAVSIMTIVIVALSATTYARNAVWSDTVRLSEDIVKKSPNKARPVYNLGLGYAEQGRLGDAVVAYKTAIRLDPYLIDAYSNLGTSYMAQGRIDEAIREFETALKMNSLDGDIHYNLASAYLTKGRVDEAISEFTASVRCKPDDPKAHYYLGVEYARQGLNDKAVNEYIIVLRLRPDDVVTRNNLGNIYNKLGRMAEALNEYQLALRIKPDFAEAHYNLGKTFATLGRREEARNEYRTALKLKPDFIEARRQLEK